jgi:hypothetical protein
MHYNQPAMVKWVGIGFPAVGPPQQLYAECYRDLPGWAVGQAGTVVMVEAGKL